MLWQFGTPNLNFRQAANHVADQMVWCGLISDNGKPEIALIKGNLLIVLDAATGAVE